MTAPSDLRARIDEALRDRRIATADELGATAVLWLAAVPVWTRSAAEAVGFPAESVTEFVRRATEAGWCETRGSARGRGSRELRFWMPDAVRREVVGALISHVGYRSAADKVTGIALELRAVVTSPGLIPGVEAPGALRAWVDLMGQVNPGEPTAQRDAAPAGTRLVEQARRAVEEGDLTLAQDLADAGEAIAAVFGGSSEQALSRARRLLALGQQRRQDGRALRRYLDRPELTGAVTRLLDRRRAALDAVARALTPLNSALSADGPADRRALLRVVDDLITQLGSLSAASPATDAALTTALNTVRLCAFSVSGSLDSEPDDYEPRAHALAQAIEGVKTRLAELDAAEGYPPRPGDPPGSGWGWALHLRGAGGVGKTMLIRYLASGQYARDRVVGPFPLARADFDHISPDYPVRRPVQLLLELADELALHTAASNRADQKLAAFREDAVRAHEAVSGLREAGGAPLRHPEVARAVDSFGDALAELGDALLILDTCEELAKADMGNPAAPAVRATLDILERLHSRAPGMRVLLAGRRRLPQRDYLTVLPVAGFTVDEARAYLAGEYGSAQPGAWALALGRQDRRSPDARDRVADASHALAPELADAMIRQSPAVDGPAPREGELPQRVSPFDLALYAAWAEENPDLSVAQVSRGSDAYIEGRIIERIGDPLVIAALPVLASAGRCRVATIVELLGRDAADVGRSLAAQEWIDADGDLGDGVAAHVTARPALARRLRRYFSADQRQPEFAARNAALATALLTRLRETPLADIDIDELIAALRLSRPHEAAALWGSIAERAMEPPGRWGTVLNMTRRLLGEWELDEWEDGAWSTMPALRATVTAAHIAGSRRDNPAFHARGDWETVRAWAGSHPNPEAGQILSARAALGLLPYLPEDESLWESFDRTLGSRLPPDRAGLAAAAAEAGHRLLEAGHVEAAHRFSRYLLTELTPKVARRSYAWARTVQARTSAEAGAGEAVLDYLVEAQDLAQRAAGPEPSWPDWILPEDLLARIWIERCLIAPPSDDVDLREWDAYAADHLDSIDGERLASLCLRIRLRHGVVDASVAERWEALDGYTPDRLPTCTAHDLVPPLCVSVAEAWMSAGEPDRALDLLSRRRGEALGTRRDQATVRHADVATMRIARRLRLGTERSLLSRLESDPESRHDAWRATAVIYREAPPLERVLHEGERPLPEWHAWWQSQVAGPGLQMPPFPPRDLGLLDSADIAADLLEVRQLGYRDRAAINAHLDEFAQSPFILLRSPRSGDRYHYLRALVRSAALNGRPLALGKDISLDEAPPRLLAELAFEEAELTALRLSRVASDLFRLAADAYERAGDRLGQALATCSIEGARSVQALRQVQALSPPVREQLSGSPRDAGPWAYWASRVQGRPFAQPAPVTPAEPEAAPAFDPVIIPQPSGPPEPDQNGRRSRGRVLVLVASLIVLAALGALAVTALPHGGGHPLRAGNSTATPTALATSPSASGSPLPPTSGGPSGPGWLILIVGLAGGLTALAGLAGSRAPRLTRLASDRGVGQARLGSLRFRAELITSLPTGVPYSRLLVAPRPWRTAPARARATAWLLAVAVRAASALARRWRGAPGYPISLAGWEPSDEPMRISWDVVAPTAGGAWWRRGSCTAVGVISDELQNLPGPHAWERILAASLAPEAAGRIEWIRVTRHPAYPYPPSGAPELLAPGAWWRALGDLYPSAPYRADGSISVRHVIGRAVATSAGPCMSIGAGPADSYSPAPSAAANPSLSRYSAAGGPGELVLAGAQVLRLDQPGIVILQAEPTTDAVGGDPPDDQGEKLALAAALAQDGVPAILLLPVLPAEIAREIAQTIIAHAARRRERDAQSLATRLRKVVALHVPPQVLDDIVLFLHDDEPEISGGNQ